MNVIYSEKKTKFEGIHKNPRFFTECDLKAKLVYTDDKKIKEAYQKKGIDVKPITQPRKA